MSDTLDKRKEYPARMFQRATVVCPSCLQRFSQADEQCKRCGFDALKVVEQFQYTPPTMERFMDHAGVADEQLGKEVDGALDQLKERFPQLGVSVCIVELDDPVSLPEFGFWMMNACKLQEGQVERDRAWSILLLMDVRRGMVSLTPGYAIEAFVEDSRWEELLKSISEDLAAQDYRVALQEFFKGCDRLLTESAKKVQHKLKKK